MTTVRALFSAWLASSIALAAAPAAAQEQEKEGTADIVVTGRAEQPTPREVTRQARAITQGSDFRRSPLPRFEDRLCPGVMGMRADMASLMIDRLRYNAGQLDRWLADDTNCAPNFIVAFVSDGQAQLATIEEQAGHLFARMERAERLELLSEEGPVRVWATTQMRTRDGMPLPRRESLADPPVLNTWMAHSRIYTAVREDITSVVVLINVKDAPGKTLVQLADYATMRGLARTRPAEDGQMLDSILTLFEPGAVAPAEMTEFDRAYLSAVYDSIPNIPGIAKINGVNRQLRRQAAAEEREQPPE